MIMNLDWFKSRIIVPDGVPKADELRYTVWMIFRENIKKIVNAFYDNKARFLRESLCDFIKLHEDEIRDHLRDIANSETPAALLTHIRNDSINYSKFGLGNFFCDIDYSEDLLKNVFRVYQDRCNRLESYMITTVIGRLRDWPITIDRALGDYINREINLDDLMAAVNDFTGVIDTIIKSIKEIQDV